MTCRERSHARDARRCRHALKRRAATLRACRHAPGRATLLLRRYAMPRIFENACAPRRRRSLSPRRAMFAAAAAAPFLIPLMPPLSGCWPHDAFIAFSRAAFVAFDFRISSLYAIVAAMLFAVC
jgi:hypothetical protein